jgi:hypothetical protein
VEPATACLPLFFDCCKHLHLCAQSCRAVGSLWHCVVTYLLRDAVHSRCGTKYSSTWWEGCRSKLQQACMLNVSQSPCSLLPASCTNICA